MLNRIGFKRRVIAVLVSLFLACHVGTQAEEKIRVATYNIRYDNSGDGQDRWSNRASTVVDYLKSLDLFGLQEVTFTQLGDLKSSLSEFEAFGVGRDDGINAGEHAVVFYRKDLMRVTEKGTFWLSENPGRIGVAGWDAALPRTCTWLKMELLASGQQFLVANTHFDHRGKQARYNSSVLIHDQLMRIAEDLPFVLMGDFNFTPESSSYAVLKRSKFLKDAREVSVTSPAGPAGTWNGFKEIATDRRIDHVFVRGELTVLKYFVDDPKTEDGRFASDHQPVRVILGLAKPIER